MPTQKPQLARNLLLKSRVYLRLHNQACKPSGRVLLTSTECHLITMATTHTKFQSHISECCHPILSASITCLMHNFLQPWIMSQRTHTVILYAQHQTFFSLRSCHRGHTLSYYMLNTELLLQHEHTPHSEPGCDSLTPRYQDIPELITRTKNSK
jgi:hypothetical protein